MAEKRFKFGKNWKSYISEKYSPEALARAEESLENFFGDKSLEGLTFLDVGCGSGIHSLAAKRLGVSRIVSIDYDEDSVACTKELAKTEEGTDWTVMQGSVLDPEFMSSLGAFDVVYCWGVAHHTGDMWKALDVLAGNVAERGFLYVAIYNTLEGYKGSKTWHKIKKMYVSSPRVVQKLMEYIYILSHVIKMLTRLRNPIRVMRDYSKKRGMSYTHDLIDWIGGYPYEHAHSEEIFLFYHEKHNMELINLRTSNFLGNNRLLFRKK